MSDTPGTEQPVDRVEDALVHLEESTPVDAPAAAEAVATALQQELDEE